MENINKTSVLLFLLLAIFSCKDDKLNSEQHLFKLDNNISNSLKLDNDCFKIFTNEFGKDEDVKLGIKFFDDMIDQINQSKKNLEYNRIILLRLIESGEVVETTKISIRENTSEDKTIISRHRNGKLTLKEVKSFSFKKLYDKLKLSENIKSGNGSSILLIDFKSADDFNCKHYDNINFDEIKSIKNMSFFD